MIAQALLRTKMLTGLPQFGFASRMQQKRIYTEKVRIRFPATGLPLAFPGGTSAKGVTIKKTKVRARFNNQPTPLHDYINFKKMSGNEILLNLDNHENLSNSELVSGLIELGRKDSKQEHDWNNHPVTDKCLVDFKKRLPSMTYKHVLQGAILLDKLQIVDSEAWIQTSDQTMRLLHKFKGRDMALFLHLYDKDILDDGEPFLNLEKCKPEFFERIVGLLPMHINHLNHEQLVQVLEVLVRRELGADRLFLNYIYLKTERNVLQLSVDQYCRTVRALADKGFTEDSVFWHDFMFKYASEKGKPKGAIREFTPVDAKQVWDTLVYLKLRNPEIDLRNTLQQVERWMPQ